MTIERAIVVDKIDKYHYKVRIPTYNKSEAAVGSTPNNELYTACVSSAPGIIPAYNVGNAVYVGFEYSDCSTPVIIGALLNNKALNIQSDINATSLTIEIDTYLPKDTHIGEVTPANIATLEGQSLRIKNEFERVDATQTEIQTSIDEINNTIIYIQEHDEEADANATSLALRVTEAEVDIVNNTQVLTNHQNNNAIHITADERTQWNNHVIDRAIHVTASEMSAWNEHLSNTITHVTSSDKTNWNSKAAANHTHSTFKGSATLSQILLNSNSYGESLPQSPKTGQLFFLLESE